VIKKGWFMQREYYSDSIVAFLNASPDEILGILATNSTFALEQSQRDAWLEEISILRSVLPPFQGSVYFEYSIPRIGQRIDVVLLIGPVIFVLEFKIGEKGFPSHAIDQVWDYALDLKNFHETSHDHFIAPILISTIANDAGPVRVEIPHHDKLLLPTKTSVAQLGSVLKDILRHVDGPDIARELWESGRYYPTPTIVEAALALYNGHSVSDISRSDASAINLHETSESISSIVQSAKSKSQKAICFVTGVPGAGKTLVGLNIATSHIDKESDLYSVFLSGNGPLVAILREALARDKVRRERLRGRKIKKGQAMSEVKMFVQNVHHFRDDCLVDPKSPPIEHVALFDEAQRAWNVEQTSNFMRRKKKTLNFNQSEPEFLISCLDRHSDWAVIVCLVGGGQEINTGEAGITEWIESLNRSFPHWHIYISPRLADSEYGAGEVLTSLRARPNVAHKDELHLAVSMRSFRAENVSLLVKQLLDLSAEEAQTTLKNVEAKYPIVVTRDLTRAKQWLREQARGSERYGIVVSSQAQRLKPHALDVRTPINPIHWFLDGKEDVRSSYYLEDVATEFHVQGLELDWACVTWDADFRYSDKGWEHWSFCGDRWNHIKNKERQNYLKNAYRVLLTRARQGMVIVVPQGDLEDRTRNPASYDPTFEYLRNVGFAMI
jgi:Schlafen group 3, DNA/RNA helicase domain